MEVQEEIIKLPFPEFFKNFPGGAFVLTKYYWTE
jgi:hypothetical protein